MSEIYGSIGFARFRHLGIAPTFGRGVSGMRERGAVAHPTRLGAQGLEGEGVTLRRLRARGRDGPQTAQDEERQGLTASADFGAKHGGRPVGRSHTGQPGGEVISDSGFRIAEWRPRPYNIAYNHMSVRLATV